MVNALHRLHLVFQKGDSNKQIVIVGDFLSLNYLGLVEYVEKIVRLRQIFGKKYSSLSFLFLFRKNIGWCRHILLKRPLNPLKLVCKVNENKNNTGLRTCGTM